MNKKKTAREAWDAWVKSRKGMPGAPKRVNVVWEEQGIGMTKQKRRQTQKAK